MIHYLNTKNGNCQREINILNGQFTSDFNKVNCAQCLLEVTGPAKFKAKFTVKSTNLGDDVIANFRVRPEVHAQIKKMADESGCKIQDVVRQMIDFSLENS